MGGVGSRGDAVLTGSPSDRFGLGATTVLVTMSLGMATVAVPLVVVAAGHDLAVVGALAAAAALSQAITRLGMGRLMEFFSTRTFVAVSTLLVGVSGVMLVADTSILTLFISQVLQGAGRAYFWTGAQTHVIRSSASSVTGLMRMNIGIGIGSLIGPMLTGFLAAFSFQLALGVSGVVALVGLVPTTLLVRFPPFDRIIHEPGARPRAVWSRREVRLATALNAVAGSWYALVTSYVPVAFAAGGQSPVTIGVLIGIANIAVLLGSTLARVASTVTSKTLLLAGVLPTGTGLAAASLLAEFDLLAGLFLAISGLGAGLLQTLAPAMATAAVASNEHGRAIISLGTVRSITILLMPLLVSGLIVIVPSVMIATGVGAAVSALPAVAVLRRRKSAT